MNRCDFCTIIKILTAYISTGAAINQSELVYGLFYSFADENADFMFDNGLVCRWVKGNTQVSPRISEFYLQPKNAVRMTEDIKENILPYMSDKAKAAQEIYDLVIADMSISEQKKSELIGLYSCGNDDNMAGFIATVLIFSIERKFVKHDSAALTAGTVSVDVSDYIFGAEPPLPCKHFSGRDSELSALHVIMETADKVFVNGIPGIGKSEFIKAYAKKYGKDYANILYFNYNGSLEKLITNADFYDDVSSEDDAVRFKKHNRFIRSLKSGTLIVIDNFNVTETNDSFFDVMMKYNCKIIFTTRCNFEYGHNFELKEISDIDTLIKITAYFYTDIDNHLNVVKDIIEAVHHHTLSVELAARLLQYGKAAPETVLEHLKNCGVDPCSDDNINLKKDGINRKASYYTHIRTLFALYLLDDDKQNIMRCMVFAPVDGIRSRLFADWLDFSNLNAVNELVELGFISNASMDLLSLHPMIREISVTDLKPSYSNCQAFVEHIHRVCLTVGAPIVCHKTVLAVAGNIMKYIAKDNIPAYLLFVEDIFGFAENYNDENVLSAVISDMNDILLDTENGTDNDRALLYNFRGYYAGRCENNLTKAISLGHKALSLCTD